jgi:hypothetical protein
MAAEPPSLFLIPEIKKWAEAHFPLQKKPLILRLNREQHINNPQSEELTFSPP